MTIGQIVYEDAKLLASDGEEWDRFGYSVAIHGDVAFAGRLGQSEHSAHELDGAHRGVGAGHNCSLCGDHCVERFPEEHDVL